MIVFEYLYDMMVIFGPKMDEYAREFIDNNDHIDVSYFCFLSRSDYNYFRMSF